MEMINSVDENNIAVKQAFKTHSSVYLVPFQCISRPLSYPRRRSIAVTYCSVLEHLIYITLLLAASETL